MCFGTLLCVFFTLLRGTDFSCVSKHLSLIETRKSIDIQSDNDFEEKIPHMQTFLFIKVTRYHEGTNEKSVYMVFFPHNHYQFVYLYFSVFQLVSTNCFSIFIYQWSD